METPLIPRGIVEWLEKLFPDCCPDLSDSEREVWAAVGAARVVRRVRSAFNEQNDPTTE